MPDEPLARLLEGWGRAGWRLLKWFVFVVVFATLPFLFLWWDKSNHFHNHIDFRDLWPKGELSLVCLALAADGISEAVFAQRRHWLTVIGGIGCALMLAGSTFLFGGAERLDEVPANHQAMMDYATYSAWAFVITFVSAAACKVATEEAE